MTDLVKCQVEKSNIKYKTVTVVPELAQKWLDTRELNNRFIRKTKVRNCAEDMVEGRWRDNAECLKLASDGELLDGVHRCLAVVQYNLEIPLRVAFNVPKEVMPTIDTGTARSFADYLRMAGEHDVVIQSGITRRYELWHRGFRYTLKLRGQITPTLSTMKEVHEKHRNEIRFATKIAGDIHYRTQFYRQDIGRIAVHAHR